MELFRTRENNIYIFDWGRGFLWIPGQRVIPRSKIKIKTWYPNATTFFRRRSLYERSAAPAWHEPFKTKSFKWMLEFADNLKNRGSLQICSHRRPTTMILTIPVLNPQSRDKKTFLVLLLALCPGGGIVKMVKHRWISLNIQSKIEGSSVKSIDWLICLTYVRSGSLKAYRTSRRRYGMMRLKSFITSA